jgi:hypothetical protein
MKIKEYMIKKAPTSYHTYIFCTPEIAAGKKREPPHDVRVVVESDGKSYTLKMTNNYDPDYASNEYQYRFKDEKSLRDMLEGINEFIHFLNTELVEK